MMNARHDRQGGAPRSVLLLLVLLAGALGVLFWTQNRGPSHDFTLGGPLFPVPKDRIEGLLLTGGGRQQRLDRAAGGVWTLSGAVNDYVDSLRAEALIDALIEAQGGPLLAGTENEDRRFEFNGPEALRLTVFVSGGDAITLALGTVNPVNGMFYGSGAGRDRCFLVTAGLRKRLGEFPLSIQAQRLLPGLDYHRAQSIILTRGRNDYFLERRDDRWWLLLPPEGLAVMGPEVRDYQALYEDRRRTDDRGVWILASEAAVREMIYDSSEIIVRRILPPEEGSRMIAEWSLDSPWRRVAVRGPGLSPDPTVPDTDEMVIAFAQPLAEDVVPALRRGNVLITDFESLTTLEKPLGVLAHCTALTFLPLRADRVTVEREGRLLLEGTKTGERKTEEGRNLWRTAFPAELPPGLDETDRHGLTQNLMVEMERIPVLTVLPPSRDAAVLKQAERVTVHVDFGTGADARREEFEIGYLDETRLPAGSAALTGGSAADRPVGLWSPATGRLLQIPDDILVTARNMVQFVPPALPD